MSLTALDSNTALIVVDLQRGIVSGTFIHPIREVVEHTCALVNSFRANNLAVVLVNVAGRSPGRTEEGPRSSPILVEGWTNLLPELVSNPAML